MSNISFQHPKGLCYVSDKYKLIFVPIPKNASTSIRNLHGIDFFTSNILTYQKELEEKKYRAFAIVRNPLKRFISGYIEVCIRASGDSPHILSKDFYWKKDKERFLKFLDELEEDLFDSHMFPQKYFLTDFQEEPFLIDAYIDIENLNKSLPFFLNKCGIKDIPENVPKLNAHGINKNTAKGGARKVDIHYPRRTLYYIMDSIVRRLQRKKLPTAFEVLEYMKESSFLRHRVEMLLEDDVRFFENVKRDMREDSMGIYWKIR